MQMQHKNVKAEEDFKNRQSEAYKTTRIILFIIYIRNAAKRTRGFFGIC